MLMTDRRMLVAGGGGAWGVGGSGREDGLGFDRLTVRSL